MKIIKYRIEENDFFYDAKMDYNEANLEIAKKEAFNGEYIICDDGGEA